MLEDTEKGARKSAHPLLLQWAWDGRILSGQHNLSQKNWYHSSSQNGDPLGPAPSISPFFS